MRDGLWCWCGQSGIRQDEPVLPHSLPVPKNALEQIRREHLIAVVPRALENNQSYYHLTTEGARSIGAPPSTAASPGGASLERDLKILYFCTRGAYPRERVTDADLRQLFEPADSPTGEHCLAQRGDELILFRVYVPATDKATAFRQVRDLTREASESPMLRDWLNREYG